MIVRDDEKNRWVVLCDCHKNQMMAEIKERRIVITDRRHGEKHVAIISIEDLTKTGIIRL